MKTLKESLKKVDSNCIIDNRVLETSLLPDINLEDEHLIEDWINGERFMYNWKGFYTDSYQDMAKALYVNHVASKDDYFFDLYPTEVQEKIKNGKKLLKRDVEAVKSICGKMCDAYRKERANIFKEARNFWNGNDWKSKEDFVGVLDIFRSAKSDLEQTIEKITKDLVVREHGIGRAVDDFMTGFKRKAENYMVTSGELEFCKQVEDRVVEISYILMHSYNESSRIKSIEEDARKQRLAEYKITSIAKMISDYLDALRTLTRRTMESVRVSNDYDRMNDMRLNIEELSKQYRRRGQKSASEQFACIIGSSRVRNENDGCFSIRDIQIVGGKSVHSTLKERLDEYRAW